MRCLYTVAIIDLLFKSQCAHFNLNWRKINKDESSQLSEKNPKFTIKHYRSKQNPASITTYLDSVENKLTNLLVVSMGKTLNGMPSSSCLIKTLNILKLPSFSTLV